MSIHYRGLSAEQVAANRQKFGANVITFIISPSLAEKISSLNASWQVKWLFRTSFVLLLLLMFMEVIGITIIQDIWFIYLLIFAIILLIYLLLVLQSCIRYWLKTRETRLQQQIANQKGMQLCRVIRNGNLVMIQRRDLVVRDVIILQKGDEIPADGELLESTSLRIDESNFTGELYANKTMTKDEY